MHNTGMINTLYSYIFPILWVVKVVIMQSGVNSNSFLKLLLLNISICLIPLTIDSIDYGIEYTKFALIIIVVIFACDYIAYERPLRFIIISIILLTILIVSYFLINSNSDQLDIWHAIKNMVIPIILTNSIQFVKIENSKIEFSIKYFISMALVATLVVVRIFVLPKFGMEFPSMNPKEIYNRLGVAIGTPLMETLFFVILCLNVFSFSKTGVVLAVVLVIPFVFFHEYFSSLDQAIYFASWHFTLLISYFITRNELFVIALHYSANIIFYIVMAIRWSVINV